MTSPAKRSASDRVLATVGSRSFLLYGLLVWVYLAFRLGSYPKTVVTCTDYFSYQRASHSVPWTWRFWAGERGFTVPLFFKLVHAPEWRGGMQLTISIVCWLVLAAVVGRSVDNRWVRPVAFVAVLAFSLSTQIVLWDAILMSESLTLSLTALLIAAWIELVRSPRPLSVAFVLSVSVLWVFARDTNAYVLLFVGALVAITLVRSEHRRLKLVLAVSCCAIFALDYASIDSGKRWLQPMRDVVTHRVIPDRSLRTYFEARGLDRHSNYPESAWMRDDSRSVYARYLLTHPIYTFTQPFRGRQVALFSTPGNAKSLIDPTIQPCNGNLDRQFLPLPTAVQRIVFPRGVTLVLLLTFAALAAAAAVFRLGGAEPVWVVPLGIVLTTYPHLLVVWHQSGIEVDRHALEGAVLLRLGVLLLAILVLDRALTLARSRRGSSRAEANG